MSSAPTSPTRACAKSSSCMRSTAAHTPPARRASSPPSPTCSGGRGRTMCAADCYQLAQALRAAAEGLGVVIRTDTACRAKSSLRTSGRAASLREQGERLFADAVVCNADCLSALTALVPAVARRSWTAAAGRKGSSRARPPSCSCWASEELTLSSPITIRFSPRTVKGRVRRHLRPRAPRRGPHRRRRLPVRHRPHEGTARLLPTSS